MKNLKFIIIALLPLILMSCGGSLPTKSDVESGKGIIAIPKSMRSQVSFNAGWVTDIEISDSNGKVVGEPVRLHPINGRQFVFVKTLLNPGKYTVSGLRRVGAGENAVGSSAPMQSLGRGIPFSIIDGEVSVLPAIFHVFIESTGSHSGFSRLKIIPLEDEELEKFKTVMTKANKNNEWEVNWP